MSDAAGSVAAIAVSGGVVIAYVTPLPAGPATSWLSVYAPTLGAGTAKSLVVRVAAGSVPLTVSRAVRASG